MRILKNKTFLALTTILLVSIFWIGAAQATTIGFSGNTFIAIDLDNGLSYYKISQADGYNNPAATSSRVGEYYPDFSSQHELDDSGLQKNAIAYASADGMTASSIFDNKNSGWIFNSNFDLETTVNGFSSQYAENSMDLYFYAEKAGTYTFNFTVDWLYYLDLDLSEGDNLDTGWYSGLTFSLDGNTLDETSLLEVLLALEEDYSETLQNEESLTISLDISLEKGFHTLYIGSYMQQYGETPVPEPATFFLLGGGMLIMGISRKIRRNEA